MPTTETIDLDSVCTYTDGRLQLFVLLCKKVGLPQIINKYLIKPTGRPCDITPATAAMILMAPMVQEGYCPLYQLNEYYQAKDMEGIFHTPVKLEQIVDERFAYLLDSFYSAGCRKIFSEICANALLIYGIQVKSINFDTTSLVMWGDYETSDGTMGAISIDFGHSKAKRPDKKQIKLGLGVADGTIVDAKVLSGNESDKTYNKENIEDVAELLERVSVDKSTFYYIADSALFSEEVLAKMKAVKMNFITRMPDNINEAKTLIEIGVGECGQQVICLNAHNKEVEYFVAESTVDYKGHALKCAVVYSTALVPTKKNSIKRKVKKEQDQLDGVIKKHQKSTFGCLDAATREVNLLEKELLAKSNFHKTTIETTSVEKKRQGRQFRDPSKNVTTTEYHLCITYKRDDFAIQEIIRKESTFILTSNDLTLSAEAMLLEYKTQSSVEKRFQQLKNPHFVNSLFLKTPERVEALTYLILLTMMILSIMERVVRQGLKNENETVITTGKKINPKPTQVMILRIFTGVRCQVYTLGGRTVRRLLKPLNACQAKIVRYLGIAESHFAWNGP